MDIFTSFGNSGLASGWFDADSFLSLLIRLGFSIGVFFVAGVFFTCALILILLLAASKSILKQSLRFGLRYFLERLFLLILFFLTLSISSVLLLFVQTLVWWKALGFGLAVGLIISSLLVASMRLAMVKFFVPGRSMRYIAEMLSYLTRLVEDYAQHKNSTKSNT